MKIASINDTNIHYKDTGSRKGPVIIFCNSLGTDLRLWDSLSKYLDKSYRIIRFDKRGHGLSDISNTPYTIKLLSQDVIALMDYLKIEKAILCGISVGGMIAQQVASSFPNRLRGVILCNTSPRIGTEEFWKERIKLIKNEGINSQADAILDRWFSARFKSENKAEIVGWKNMLTRTTLEGYVATCEALRITDLSHVVEKITVPALCIASDEDLVTTPKNVQDMAMMIEDATFVRIDGAGHLPPIEQPEILAFHIHDFIKENGLGLFD
ncbi:MAG: 3-oxoadipate enol-lactonase [Alphaproteobacteria bacterium]|nr:3-oxoadipate enol-lactonase [Alphaproteobacteria bacterium]HPF45896.1 3-oxoadipate enol-lactonase [Emcibacteraceae bacterium]HRW28562.1 3-oxoadipate enol-lactonase [Emcibacteraceae bacterium]